MHRPHLRLASAVLASATLLLMATSPAGAVVNAQPDYANAFPNVGAIEYASLSGDWFAGCSGTLIAQDLVLTAAHCVAVSASDTIPTDQVRVNFNPALSFPADPADPLAYDVAAVMVPPTLARSGPGRAAGNVVLSSPWDDVALLRLTDDVVGISPAPVAGLGYLDAIDLRNATFTAVGYGINGFTIGNAVIDFSYRSFATGVRALGHDAYPDRYLKISEANCFGDSGGPLFHDGTVVGITVWTNSERCEAPGLDFRVDSAVAQELISANL